MSQPDVPLSPAQRSKIRRLSIQVEPSPGEEAGELNIIPYLDIITNILVFVLASISVIFLSSIDTSPPAIGGGKVKQQIDSKALNLTVLISNKGVTLKTSGGNIATGCNEPGPGVTVPISPDSSGKDSYNWSAVTECARKLKSARPEFEDETQVTLTANPGSEFRLIIDAIDSLRNDAQGELFPDVHFGAAR
jgi:biopolymer transport protein TolR